MATSDCGILATAFPSIVNASVSCCLVAGVECSGTTVTAVNFSNRSLSGSVPPVLGSLGSLVGLNLSNNSLSGSIPAALSQLGSLYVLDLSQNRLSGSVPAELTNLPLLEILGLESNALSGAIPPELGRTSSLKYLRLHDNALTSRIPDTFGNLSKLVTLSLYDNQLYGDIPKVLANLPALQFVQLSNNYFSGSVPNITSATGEYTYDKNCLAGVVNQRSPTECASFSQTATASSPTSTSTGSPGPTPTTSNTTAVVAGAVAGVVAIIAATVGIVVFSFRRRAMRHKSGASVQNSGFGVLSSPDHPATDPSNEQTATAVIAVAPGSSSGPSNALDLAASAMFDAAVAVSFQTDKLSSAAFSGTPKKLADPLSGDFRTEVPSSSSSSPGDAQRLSDQTFIQEFGPVSRWTHANAMDWARSRGLSASALTVFSANNVDGPALVALHLDLSDPSFSASAGDTLRGAWGVADFGTRRELVAAVVGLRAAAEEEGLRASSALVGSGASPLPPSPPVYRESA